MEPKQATEQNGNSETILFVKNLPYSLTEEDVKKLFENYEVVKVEINKKYDKKQNANISSGFGFVTVKNADAHKRAINEMDGFKTEIRKISVAAAYLDKKKKISDTELYVSNLPCSLKKEDFGKLFEKYGVSEVKIKMKKDQKTNTDKRFGFVTFKNADAQKKAIKEMNEREVYGRKIIVEACMKKQGEDGVKKVSENSSSYNSTEEIINEYKICYKLFNVSEGDCAVVTIENEKGKVLKSILIDASISCLTGNDNFMRYLETKGIIEKDIIHFDAVVITHWDEDHYVGFVNSGITTKKLFCPSEHCNRKEREGFYRIEVLGEKKKINQTLYVLSRKVYWGKDEIFEKDITKPKSLLDYLFEDDEILKKEIMGQGTDREIDILFLGVDGYVVGPKKQQIGKENKNASSISMLIKSNGVNLLTCGDLELECDEKVREYLAEQKIQIFKVNHHGSKVNNDSETLANHDYLLFTYNRIVNETTRSIITELTKKGLEKCFFVGNYIMRDTCAEGIYIEMTKDFEKSINQNPKTTFARKYGEFKNLIQSNVKNVQSLDIFTTEGELRKNLKGGQLDASSILQRIGIDTKPKFNIMVSFWLKKENIDAKIFDDQEKFTENNFLTDVLKKVGIQNPEDFKIIVNLWNDFEKVTGDP